MLPRALAAALALIGLAFAPAAHAASIVLTPDQGIYFPGDAITLTVTVTTSDSPGTLDNTILGRILHNSAQVTSLNNAAQNALVPFANGSLAACTTTDCEVFDQIAFPNPVNPGVTNFVLATVGYTIDPNIVLPATIVFNWKTVSPGKLDFFGLTSAPGVVVTLMPEPTTAAMLALGLFGLALYRRRR